MIIIDRDKKRYSLLDFQKAEFTEGEYAAEGATWDITEDRVVVREPQLIIYFTTGEILTIQGEENVRSAKEMIGRAVLVL